MFLPSEPFEWKNLEVKAMQLSDSKSVEAHSLPSKKFAIILGGTCLHDCGVSISVPLFVVSDSVITLHFGEEISAFKYK